MPEYRFYAMDNGGPIGSSSIYVECRNDDDALARALDRITDQREVEVWAGVRCVGRTSLKTAGDKIRKLDA